MSRHNDVAKCLPKMLTHYSENSHQAIVETFSTMLEEGWNEENISLFLKSGLGFSATADTAIMRELSCWGIEEA